ncbi:hypothetical protein [Rhodopseudomonas parapalustris]
MMIHQKEVRTLDRIEQLLSDIKDLHIKMGQALERLGKDIAALEEQVQMQPREIIVQVNGRTVAKEIAETIKNQIHSEFR